MKSPWEATGVPTDTYDVLLAEVFHHQNTAEKNGEIVRQRFVAENRWQKAVKGVLPLTEAAFSAVY